MYNITTDNGYMYTVLFISIHNVIQVAALKKLVDDNNTTLTESIVSLILDLQWASRSIENLRKDSVSHTSHLTTLKTEITNLKSIEEEERRKVVERLEVLESAKLSHEDLAKAFQEEIEKSVSNNTSVIWTWLHQVSRQTARAQSIRSTCYKYQFGIAEVSQCLKMSV